MPNDDIPTQGAATQTQISQIFTNLESQPIENIIWGRLYAKSVQIKSLDLCQKEFTAGRGDSNNLCLTIEELPEKILSRISKVHFKIEREISDLLNPVYIQDFSRNGTFVNGDRIGINQKRILQNDDVISLAHPLYKAFVFKDLSPNAHDVNDLPKLISDRYYLSRKLGSGACGVVRLVYNLRTCNEFAMKHVKKNLLSGCTNLNGINDPARVMNEVKIMTSLEHPCVIKMHDIVDMTDSVYMVLEYMKGGDLLTRILKTKRLTENISKLYFYQICHAVKYLHDKGITHRDLKPDNVLLETEDDETLLKVSDFGLSKFVRKDSIMRTLCGTPFYVAPEVIMTGGRGSYTKKVDIWSLGVVLFTCLSGTLPFSEDYGSPVSEQIKKGDFHFKHPSWRNISINAKSLIMDMLTVNANRRPSIDYILRHKWLRDPKIIRKANSLMKIDNDLIEIMKVNDENHFLEPPAKRFRR